MRSRLGAQQRTQYASRLKCAVVCRASVTISRVGPYLSLSTLVFGLSLVCLPRQMIFSLEPLPVHCVKFIRAFVVFARVGGGVAPFTDSTRVRLTRMRMDRFSRRRGRMSSGVLVCEKLLLRVCPWWEKADIVCTCCSGVYYATETTMLPSLRGGSTRLLYMSTFFQESSR